MSRDDETFEKCRVGARMRQRRKLRSRGPPRSALTGKMLQSGSVTSAVTPGSRLVKESTISNAQNGNEMLTALEHQLLRVTFQRKTAEVAHLRRSTKIDEDRAKRNAKLISRTQKIKAAQCADDAETIALESQCMNLRTRLGTAKARTSRSELMIAQMQNTILELENAVRVWSRESEETDAATNKAIVEANQTVTEMEDSLLAAKLAESTAKKRSRDSAGIIRKLEARRVALHEEVDAACELYARAASSSIGSTSHDDGSASAAPATAGEPNSPRSSVVRLSELHARFDDALERSRAELAEITSPLSDVRARLQATHAQCDKQRASHAEALRREDEGHAAAKKRLDEASRACDAVRDVSAAARGTAVSSQSREAAAAAALESAQTTRDQAAERARHLVERRDAAREQAARADAVHSIEVEGAVARLADAWTAAATRRSDAAQLAAECRAATARLASERDELVRELTRRRDAAAAVAARPPGEGAETTEEAPTPRQPKIVVRDIELPTGPLGMVFAPDSATITTVRETSAVQGKVHAGERIVALVRPGLGKVDCTGMNGATLTEMLVAFKDQPGRVISVAAVAAASEPDDDDDDNDDVAAGGRADQQPTPADASTEAAAAGNIVATAGGDEADGAEGCGGGAPASPLNGSFAGSASTLSIVQQQQKKKGLGVKMREKCLIL